MKTTIRPAILADLHAIIELNHKLFLSDLRSDPTLNTDWSYQPAGKEYFSDKISGVSGVCFVAVIGDSLIGYVVGRVYSSIDPADTILRCELDNIYVEQGARGQGAGKLLTQELISWCREKGAQSMFVTAYSQNVDAIGFYQTCGFEPYATKLERKL